VEALALYPGFCEPAPASERGGRLDSRVAAEVSTQLLLFAEQTTDFVGVADPWGRILYLNPAARKRLGVADVIDLTLADVFPLEAFNFYYEVVRPELLRTGSWTGEVLVNIAGGDAVPMYVSTSANLGPGGETRGGVVYARELARAGPAVAADELELVEAAGLLPQSVFDDRVRRALAAAARDEQCALVLVNIVGRSDAIDASGPDTEASVTRSLTGRMTRLARTIDIVGRVGERQLGLLLRGVRSRGEALRIAEMVHQALVDPPVTTAGGEAAVAVGCGVAFSRPGDDPDDLIERAWASMSYEPAIRDADVGAAIAVADRAESSASMDDFRVGLSHGDVRPYAQPVVDLRSGRVVGYRGQARWHHRRLGVLKPAAFIDMIAETPLANEVDLYIARETAAVLALAARDLPLRLYTPVSKRVVTDIRTEQYLSEIADAFFLSMDQMRLELAHSLLDSRSPVLRDALESLRDSGVALVVTGVEAVAGARELAEQPFDELHISRRLTDAAATDRDAGRTISEIVRLAHDGALVAGAAGVDHQRHRDLLVEAGCDLATGALYGKPEPANTIE
jgi:EAL domain-containing protein (putative c-di-GMP-specific phosphodiesterase class I)/GGDEF domain-containing protein